MSQCLQPSSLLAAAGQEITKHKVTGLVEKRNDECFWSVVESSDGEKK